MRVVVTGASGNVGTSLLRELGDEPVVESVLGLARRRPAVELAKTRWEACDVATDDLAPHFRGADAVVHLAWLIQPSRDEGELERVNLAGSRRVFEAVADAGVPTLVYASSIGAYGEGPKGAPVDETWPTTGTPSSFYARHKAEVERMLDAFEAAHPSIRVVRLRPGLIFKREAATEIRRYFLGPLFPSILARKRLLPFVPDLARLRFQAVHADDVAAAYRLALVSEARGAFNVAADPVLDSPLLAKVLGARAVKTSPRLLRAGAAAAWRLRLQPTPEGWVDMALAVPVMDTRRAREELGWEPRRDAVDALEELLEGIRQGAGFPTPPLDPRSGGRLRARELRTGVGARGI